MKDKIEIYFSIDSDVIAPDKIHALVGLPPDESWAIGDSYRIAGKNKTCKFNRWSIVEYAESSSFIEDAVNRIVSRLLPYEANIIELSFVRQKLLSICMDTGKTVFGVGVSVDAINFMSRVGAELDISLTICDQRESK